MFLIYPGRIIGHCLLVFAILMKYVLAAPSCDEVKDIENVFIDRKKLISLGF